MDECSTICDICDIEMPVSFYLSQACSLFSRVLLNLISEDVITMCYVTSTCRVMVGILLKIQTSQAFFKFRTIWLFRTINVPWTCGCPRGSLYTANMHSMPLRGLFNGDHLDSQSDLLQKGAE